MSPAPGGAMGQLLELIRRRFGLDFGGQRFPLLLEGLGTHGRDPEHAAELLLSGDPARLAGFIEQLANGETYFLRHPMQLEAIRSFVLDRAASARTRGSRAAGILDAWCVGCSTGEEPLSLAMALLEARDAGGPQELKILATDLSGAAVDRARAARYGEWSFRGVPAKVRERYFRQLQEEAEPVPALRRPIVFEQHNLLAGPPGGATFDLVLCRNVLIYFDRPSFDAALATFRSAVRPGGLLVLGPAEAAARVPPGFVSIDVDGVILYQRDELPALPLSPEDAGGGRPSRRSLLPDSPPRGLPRAPAAAPWARPATHAAGRAAPEPVRATGELAPISPLAMARLAADQGRHQDARTLLERQLDVAPHAPEALVVLALVELDANRLDEAADALDRLHAAAPGSLMGGYLMGSLLQALGRTVAAAQWYRSTLDRLTPGAAGDGAPVEHGGGLCRAELARTLESLLRGAPTRARGSRS